MSIKWTLYEKTKLFELVKEYEGVQTSWIDIAEEFRRDPNCNNRTSEQLRGYWKYNFAGTTNRDKIIERHKKRLLKILVGNKAYVIGELCERFNITESYLLLLLRELMSEGYNIVIEKDIIYLGRKEKQKVVLSEGTKREYLKFAVVTDTHLGSKYQQLTALKNFYKEAQKEGVELFFHVGDLDDGFNVYGRKNNHLQEVFLVSFEDRKKYIIDNYPVVENGKTLLISGNHDDSWFNLSGADLLEYAAKERSDIDYLGKEEALVKYKGYTFLMHHGSGKNTLNAAYKLQKLIDVKKAEYPELDFAFQGHYHTSYFLPYKHVFGIQGGCFQGKTPFGKTMGFAAPLIGGWIVEVTPTNTGYTVKTEYKVYPEVECDY